MSDYDKILNKVRKLLKLSKGKANLNESATAAEMAQRLMEEYRIKQTELKLEEEETVQPDLHDLFEYDGPKVAMWKVDLAVAIGNANACACYYIKGYSWKGMDGKKNVHPSQIRMSGTKANFNTCFYMFFYLMTTIELLCKKEGRGKGQVWARSFRAGAVSMIRQRLEKAKEEARENLRKQACETATDSTTALVRLDSAIAKVDSEMAEATRFLTSSIKLKRTVRRSRRVDEGGYSAGKKAAKNLTLDPRNKGKLTKGSKSLRG